MLKDIRRFVFFVLTSLTLWGTGGAQPVSSQVNEFRQKAGVEAKALRHEAAARFYEQAIEEQKRVLASVSDLEVQLNLQEELASLEILRGGQMSAQLQDVDAGRCYTRAEELRSGIYTQRRKLLEGKLEKSQTTLSGQALFITCDAYLNMLNNLASERSDFSRASEYASSRLALVRAQQPLPGLVATALEALASARLRLADSIGARKLALEALQIREEKMQREGMGRTVYLLAQIAEEALDWDTALTYYRETIELAGTGALPPVYDLSQSSPDLLEGQRSINVTERQVQVMHALYSRLSIGTIEVYRSNYRLARESFDSAESELSRIFLAGEPDEEKLLEHKLPLAHELYAARLKLAGTDPAGLRRLQMARLIAGSVETSLGMLRARLQEDLGNYAEADQAYIASAASVAQLTGQVALTPQLQLARARVQVERGEYASAEGLLREAAEQFRRVHDTAKLARTLGEVSTLRRREGHPLEAVKIAREAMALVDTLPAPDPLHPAPAALDLTAQLDDVLGAAEQEVGGTSLGDSERHLRASVASRRRYHLRGGLAFSLSKLGYTLELQHRDAEALQAYREAVGLIEDIAAVGDVQASGFHFRRINTELYQRLIRLQIRLGQPGQAWRYLERLKGTTLVQALAGSQVNSANAVTQALVTTMRQCANDMQAADFEVRRSDPGQLESARSRLAASEKAYRAAVDALNAADPGYASLVAVVHTDLAELGKKLPPGVVVLEYFAAEDGLFIFTVSADHGPQVFSSPLSRPKLAEEVARYRNLILRGYGSDVPGARLYSALLGPVQTDFDRANTLILIAGGDLADLPFQALPTPDKSVLIEKKTLVYLSQAKVLESILGSPEPVPPHRSLLALGNPDGSLPAAQREVGDVGSTFREKETYIGSEATLAHLIHPRVQPGYLHLATHGFLNGADPKDSYLLLAGQPSHLRVQDILEAHFGLEKLGTRLVTLSACETQRGAYESSAVYGSLAGAFNKAGVSTVVASLWKVSDESTRVLMGLFYAELAQGVKPALALRKAQIKMRAQPEYARPFFWAPFVVMGDWR